MSDATERRDEWLRTSLSEIVEAIETNAIKVDSPNIGGGDPETGYEPYFWIDEWLHHAKSALATPTSRDGAEGTALPDEIKAADVSPPEATFNDGEAMLGWLNDDATTPKPAAEALQAEVVAWRMKLPSGECTSWFNGKPPKFYSQSTELAYASTPLRGEREALVPPVKAADDWRGALWRERLRGELHISSDLDHRSWREIKRAILSLQSGAGTAADPAPGGGPRPSAGGERATGDGRGGRARVEARAVSGIDRGERRNHAP